MLITSLRATTVVAVSTFTSTSTHLRYDISSGASSRDSDNASCSATCANEGTSTDQLVNVVPRRVDGTWKTVATITNNLDAKCWLLFAEGCGRLEVNGIPSQLDESLTAFDSVSAENVWSPITLRLL